MRALDFWLICCRVMSLVVYGTCMSRGQLTEADQRTLQRLGAQRLYPAVDRYLLNVKTPVVTARPPLPRKVAQVGGKHGVHLPVCLFHCTSVGLTG